MILTGALAAESTAGGVHVQARPLLADVYNRRQDRDANGNYKHMAGMTCCCVRAVCLLVSCVHAYSARVSRVTTPHCDFSVFPFCLNLNHESEHEEPRLDFDHGIMVLVPRVEVPARPGGA